jgi:hypothetical protein
MFKPMKRNHLGPSAMTDGRNSTFREQSLPRHRGYDDGDNTEVVIETLENFSYLTWLMATKDFIKRSHHENFVSYYEMKFEISATPPINLLHVCEQYKTVAIVTYRRKQPFTSEFSSPKKMRLFSVQFLSKWTTR